MKRYFRGCMILSLIFTVLLLSACKEEKTEEPQLKIVVGEQELQGIYYGNQHNQTREEIENKLKKVMESKSWEELPYVSMNEIITIKAENFHAEELEVFDYILTRTGMIRYNEKSVLTSIIQVDEGKATITLSTNPVAFASSNSEDYLPGRTIRCFVIRTDIDNSSFAFAFILRTDVE